MVLIDEIHVNASYCHDYLVLQLQVTILSMTTPVPAEVTEAGGANSDFCLILSGDPFQRQKELLKDGGEVPDFYAEVV